MCGKLFVLAICKSFCACLPEDRIPTSPTTFDPGPRLRMFQTHHGRLTVMVWPLAPRYRLGKGSTAGGARARAHDLSTIVTHPPFHDTPVTSLMIPGLGATARFMTTYGRSGRIIAQGLSSSLHRRGPWILVQLGITSGHVGTPIEFQGNGSRDIRHRIFPAVPAFQLVQVPCHDSLRFGIGSHTQRSSPRTGTGLCVSFQQQAAKQYPQNLIDRPIRLRHPVTFRLHLGQRRWGDAGT